MAVTIANDSSYGLALLPLLGVSPSMCEVAKSIGIAVEQTSVGNFVVTYGGQEMGTVPIKGQALSLAKSGQLGPASKQAFQFQLEQAIKKAMDLHSSGVQPSKVDSPIPQEEDQVVKSVMKKSILGAKSTSSSGGGGVVPLHDATELYQQVHGTSSGSVYQVVILLDGAAVAARVKGKTLSLRVEGPKLTTYKDSLTDLGFSIKDANKYSSVHFDIGEIGLGLKTIGAVAGRLGFDNVKAVGDLTKVGGA